MLKVIRRIVQQVNRASGLSEALSIIVGQVKSAMNVDVCSVYLTDHRRKRHVLRATDGLNPQSVGLSLDYAEGLVGTVAVREEPINQKDAFKHPNFRYLPETGEERYHAFLGVPVIHARKLLGVLVVQEKEKKRFSSSQEAFLVTICAQLAGVIAHAEATGAISHFLHAEELQVAPRSAVLTGISGASGIAIGIATVVYPPMDLDEIPDRPAKNIAMEIRRFQRASRRAVAEIRVLGRQLKKHLPPEEQALFVAYEQILSSDSIGNEVVQEIQAGHWAQGALKNVIQKHVHIFESMEDEYLRERSADLRDLGLRVLVHLQKTKMAKNLLYGDATILVGEEVTASQMAEVPRRRLAGVVSKQGSRNSHLAILARAMDIPFLTGLEELPVVHLDGQPLILDGFAGELHIAPSDKMRAKYLSLIAAQKELKAGLAPLSSAPAITRDGFSIPLYVNAGLTADINISLQGGAEGVGLYRTEIPFMVGDRFPSEEAQRAIYRRWLEAFSPKPVIMRTLDIGGDKPLSYFSIEEDNPFLGWRGIRISLDHPEIFLIQVRAMLQASHGLNNLSIMLPMVSRLEEVEEALILIRRAYDEIRQELDIKKPSIGVMLEVPSAIYQAQAIAKRVDFLSVGSNDLTQYLLAVDRNNARVSNAYDGLHPAVLRALHQAVESAHKEGKPISICGEMAGDPFSVLLLVAMGFDTLSMNASSLLKVKYVLKHFMLKEARKLLNDAMQMEKAAHIREHVVNALKQKNLKEMALLG